ncbi:MAG: DUF7009 family protein [Gammaproteobacteria bacterium]
MKLRIRGNSIRMRVTQSELAEIAADGEVRETVEFGDATLTYALVRDAFDSAPSASFRDNVITLRLPADTVRRWVETRQVSIRASQRLEHGGELQLLVEKDFACLEPRPGEDESDTFPHPEAGGKRG